uniref:Uncharacterized protein n=1 Tax=Anguilla anguilla TaxID=7936 RepID=A0A0E9X1T5_ANGAN
MKSRSNVTKEKFWNFLTGLWGKTSPSVLTSVGKQKESNGKYEGYDFSTPLLCIWCSLTNCFMHITAF